MKKSISKKTTKKATATTAVVKSVRSTKSAGKNGKPARHIAATTLGSLHFLLGGLIVPLLLVVTAGIIAGVVISFVEPGFSYDSYKAYVESINSWGPVAAAGVIATALLAWIGAFASAEYLKRKYKVNDPNKVALTALSWILLLVGVQLFADILNLIPSPNSDTVFSFLPAYGATTIAAVIFWPLVFFTASRYYLGRKA